MMHMITEMIVGWPHKMFDMFGDIFQSIYNGISKMYIS